MKNQEKLSVGPFGIRAEGDRSTLFVSILLLVGMVAAFFLGQESAIVKACLNWNWKLF
jgi:hypothetical protein